MKEGNSFIIIFKKTMVASKGIFRRNVAYIPSNWKDIHIADMNELGDMLKKVKKDEEIPIPGA